MLFCRTVQFITENNKTIRNSATPETANVLLQRESLDVIERETNLNHYLNDSDGRHLIKSCTVELPTAKADISSVLCTTSMSQLKVNFVLVR